MIIFGMRGKTISGQETSGPACDHCGTSLYLTFCLLRYFHIFWIPIVPTSTTCGLECRHCRKVRLGKELPGDLARDIRQRLFSPARLIPYFTGAVLIVAVVGLAVSSGVQEAKNTDRFIAAPRVNDLYVFSSDKLSKDAAFPYTIMKVVSVENDGVLLQMGEVHYKTVTGASEAITSGEAYRDDYYSDEVFTPSTAELKSFLERGMIDSVRRRE